MTITDQSPVRSRARFAMLAVVAMAAAPAQAIEVLVPSYFYPSGPQNDWPRMNSAASQVALTAILNPASGPGAAADGNYIGAINSLRSVGGRVIGYVSTAYTARPIADVKADVARYRSFYPIDGIFFDEMTSANEPASIAYYQELYAYVKSLDASYRVVTNPGTNVPQAYFSTPVADTIVTFESNTGYTSWNPSSYTGAYATRRFSNLPYNVATATAMDAAVARAVSRRVGYVYVTDDSGDNPWDRLPTYWNEELASIRLRTPTWNIAGSGNWMANANWTTTAAPNGAGAEAMLLGGISGAQTLYANSPITLGTLVLSNASRYVISGAGTLTMDASVDSALIDVRRGHHTINLPLTLMDRTIMFVAQNSSLTVGDPLTIAPGASLEKAGPGTLTFTSTVEVQGAALRITDGTVALGQSARLASLVMGGTGTLDIGRADAVIGGMTLENARTMIGAAYADGDWSGSGVASSAVDARHGIGYANQASDVLLRHALYGDVDLDGSVTFSDLQALAGSYGQAGSHTWASGDLNYDGAVTDEDLRLLAMNYDAARFDGDWSAARSIVPEPGIAACAAAASVLLRRRCCMERR